jgi:CRP-like cAMP-binding protein
VVTLQVKLLVRLPVFKGIAISLLRQITAIMERRTYRLGTFIFRQGENANSMFVLVSGSVRIVRQMHVSDRIARMQQLVR